MRYWFADHTDFRSQKGSQVPDVFIFGGVLIPKEELEKLIGIFQDVKARYTHPNMPVKYNLRDLKDKYEEFARGDEYRKLLNESYEWRQEIFRRASDLNYSIVLSCIESFQKGKAIGDKKDDLLRYSFSNALMRVGMEIESLGASCTVVLDWPVGNNPKPFDREYYAAFNDGKSIDGIKYLSGALRKLNFNGCVYYANMNHSIGLQFSDLVVGAFRDGVKAHRDDHPENLGRDITKIFLPKIRTDTRSRILQRGIIISKNNHSFIRFMKKYIEELK